MVWKASIRAKNCTKGRKYIVSITDIINAIYDLNLNGKIYVGISQIAKRLNYKRRNPKGLISIVTWLTTEGALEAKVVNGKNKYRIKNSFIFNA